MARALEQGCDTAEVRRFRERFMGACDGKSAERIISYITDNNDNDIK